MNYTNNHYEIAITLLDGVGPKRAKQLLETVNNIDEIFTDPYQKLSLKTGFSISFLKNMHRNQALKKSEKVVLDYKKFNIETVFYTHPNFPRRLKQCPDAPMLLFYKGDIEFNQPRYVAIVGTRNATEYGKQLCKELVESFVGNNIVVVSGLAYGIDIAVHRYCVELGIPTVAVLAHGLEIIYPSDHLTTAKKMCGNGGLISEYPPYTNPDRENFPMRNRIVAGMCDATIVVESKLRGGSLITAELANDYNKDVYSFPGRINDEYSAGCNKLIADTKATLIVNGNDFLTKMGWNNTTKKTVQRSIFPVMSSEEEAIVNELIKNPEVSIDGIAMNLKLPISAVNVSLFQLEMNGIVQTIPGNKCKLI